mmetsp:Transcript_37453/g.92668  ORF Transcript_37453/g.92668 Transcript_37453/m.92668 type:complete len:210 (-) Transcript_37453:261-890(-)
MLLRCLERATESALVMPAAPQSTVGSWEKFPGSDAVLLDDCMRCRRKAARRRAAASNLDSCAHAPVTTDIAASGSVLSSFSALPSSAAVAAVAAASFASTGHVTVTLKDAGALTAPLASLTNTDTVTRDLKASRPPGNTESWLPRGLKSRSCSGDPVDPTGCAVKRYESGASGSVHPAATMVNTVCIATPAPPGTTATPPPLGGRLAWA